MTCTMTCSMTRFWIAMASLLVSCLAGKGVAHAETPAQPPYVLQQFEAEETRVYSREFKKLEVSATLELAPGASEPKLNLVEVSEQGDKLRFLGILLYNPKKKRWIRKVELLEREPRKLFLEIVPDSELEPFQKRERKRIEIEVVQRPSLIDILRGVFQKSRDPSSESCAQVLPSVPLDWKVLDSPGIPSGTRGTHGVRKQGGEGQAVYAALRAIIERPMPQIQAVLWEPANLKNLEKTRLKVESVQPTLKKVAIELRPILWLKLLWNETWELAEIKPGSQVRISYRKIDGDDRIRHFCGWMELERVDEKSTQVTLYEEIDAPRRSSEDVLGGHIGTVRRILTP